jgi:hypothetical protein
MSGILLTAGCCCESGSPYPCTHCSDKTPQTLEVTFSSITVCSACYVIGGGPVSYKFTTAPPTPAGPYTLAQTAGNRCVYEYSGGVSGQIDMYPVSTCTGGSSSFPLINLVIRATFTASALALSAWWTHASSGPMAMYGPNTYFFSATLNPTSVCDGPWSPGNAYSACNTSGPTYMAHSGTASIVSRF